MEYTPVKTDPTKDSIDSINSSIAENQTPVNVRTNHEDGESLLVGSFSGMKIQQAFTDDNESSLNGGLLKFKRRLDNRTVEGSPCVQGIFKRLDVHPTPAKEIFQEEHKSRPLLQNTDEKKLLIVYSASDEHDTGVHQENSLRTALLCGGDGCLRRSALSSSIDWLNTDSLFDPCITDLLRVHEYDYLMHLENKCHWKQLQDSNTLPANTIATHLPPFYAPLGMLDGDTPLGVHSFRAAKRACSAAILTVDCMMRDYFQQHHFHNILSPTVPNEATNNKSNATNRAFLISRPPGHHAGPNGCVPSVTFWKRPDMTSSGFCLLNTVAIAAAYARYTYGSLAIRNQSLLRSHALSSSTSSAPASTPIRLYTKTPRIAIVDIDVHHGNGTEEIVRCLRPRQVYLPLPSSWAPVSKTIYKPWLNDTDAEEVFFSSIQLFADEKFYPGSGNEQYNEQDTKDGKQHIVNIGLTPIGPGPWDEHARQKLTPAKRDTLIKAASAEFRAKVSTLLLPKLASFQPDLLFISAGFDTHYDDFYHFLHEDDIHWITKELCAIVDTVPDSIGVISILEGGYSLSSPIVPPPPTARQGGGKGSSSVAATAAATTAAAGGSSDEHAHNTRRKGAHTTTAVGSNPPPPGTSPSTATSTTTITTTVLTPATMYAQQPGDGGLVKGVLAHTAALIGKPSWL